MKQETVCQVVGVIPHFSLKLHIQFWKYFHSMVLCRVTSNNYKNKKSSDHKRLLFSSKPLMMNIWNQGSKENLGVKFKEGVCVKLCSKLWFESGWIFCNINNSEWFWIRLSRKKVLNNHFLKSLQKQPYANVLQNRCS